MTKVADISQWQGNVNFVKLKVEVDFVILRVGAGMLTDSQYANYAAQCKAHGIPFGTYLYAKYVDVNDAVTEARNAFNHVSKDSVFFVLDSETISVRNVAELVPAAQAFIDTLHKLGLKKVGLYSGAYFYTAHGFNRIKADFLWLAEYPSGDNGTLQQSAKPSIPCDLWQYTEKGHLDGIGAYVDLDVLEDRKPLSYFTDASTTEPIKLEATSPAVPMATNGKLGVVTVLADVLNVHHSQSLQAPVIAQYHKGDTYNVYKEENGMYCVADGRWITSIPTYVSFKHA